MRIFVLDLQNSVFCTLAESIFVEIPCCQKVNGKSILVGCIYRPPDSDINTFIDALHSTLDIINKECKLCALPGDFSIDLLKGDLTSTADFLNALHTFNFLPFIIKPSRITMSSATLIDNIFFNSLDFEVM